MSGQKPREIAAQVLKRARRSAPGQDAQNALSGGQSVDALLETTLAQAPLAPADRRLCHELVYGVVRWRATLDWLIAQKTAGRVQADGLQIILQLGLYQIFWLDRVPQHAAVHESVEMAKRAGYGPKAGFVNALLRGYARALDETRELLDGLKKDQPALGYSHPDWLVARWTRHFDKEGVLPLLEWNNTPPRTYARVNTLKTEPGKLLEQWREEKVDYDFVRGDWFEDNLVFELKSHPPLGRLPSMQQGGFYVQDPSTLLAVTALAPQPGETILDLCAAPGGKLTLIAQRMKNQGRLVGHDLVPERLDLMRANCERLGATCVEVVTGDWLDKNRAVSFDRILVDAPCSNTGVMRRRVDLRWRIRPEEMERLRGVQLDLMRQCAPRLKRGGTLVYSTCSLEPEENGQVVRQFQREYNQFKLAQERELLPFRDKVDGAYVALLQHQ